MARRTDSNFNRTVLRRLNHSRVSRYPMSLSNIAKNMSKNADKIAVVVAKVLDDERFLDVPKMTVCALSFSNSARRRIVAAGGSCMTFDQLALKCPQGANTVLLRGHKRREALKHFGTPRGCPFGHAKPYVRSRNAERHKGLR